MCGICGVAGAPVTERELLAMRDTLIHRGPDGSGLDIRADIAFGHRRLAILDLSDAGAQPMTNEDGSIVMVMNGEIYNYRELRRDLEGRGHRFRSRCDAEVLVHLYEEEGENFPSRLNGIFAIAIWDERRRRLLLVRDQLGVKPLYVRELPGGGLSFASEVRALPCPAGGHEPDPRAWLDYLLLQYPLGSKTFWRGVERILPGEMITWEPGRGSRRRTWWSLPDPSAAVARGEHGGDPAADSRRLRSLLEAAVDRQLQGDVPVGCHLSGGLDTAIVAACAVPRMPGVHAFTGAFSGPGPFDDAAAAAVTARRLGLVHHVIRPDPREFAAGFARFADAMEEPMAAPGGYAQFCVAEAARKHVTVVLGGQGADETWGGYARHLVAALDPAFNVRGRESLAVGHQLDAYGPLRRQLEACEATDAGRRYLSLIRRDGGLDGRLDPASILHRDFIESAGAYSAEEAFLAAFHEGDAADDLDRILRYETRHWLPALLHVEDRTSMAFGLESRVPLLDITIVEEAFRLPTSHRMRGGRLKGLLRDAVADLVDPFILDRADKIGFPVPSTLWNNVEPAVIPSWMRPEVFLRHDDSGPQARMRWGLLSLTSIPNL